MKVNKQRRGGGTDRRWKDITNVTWLVFNASWLSVCLPDVFYSIRGSTGALELEGRASLSADFMDQTILGLLLLSGEWSTVDSLYRNS